MPNTPLLSARPPNFSQPSLSATPASRHSCQDWRPPTNGRKFRFPIWKAVFFGKKSKKTFLIKLPSTVYTDDFSRTSEFIVSTYTFPARKDMTKFLPGNSFSLIFQDQGCFFKIKQNTELQTMLKKEIKKQLNAFCAVAGAAVKSA